MNTKMKQVRIQILDLVDKHQGNFDICPGCDICSQIKYLQKSIKLLERKPEEKFKHILDKGRDMTRSDIELLLDNEVKRRDIQKALHMDASTFFKMLENFGLRKKRGKNDMAKITKEEYQDYKAQGLSDKEIAVKKNIHPNYLPELKKKWDINPIQANTAVNKAHECNCSSKEEKATYERMVADLKDKLELEIAAGNLEKDKLEKEIKYWKEQAQNQPAPETSKENTSDGPDYHELFDDAMAEKETLHKEYTALENRLETLQKNSQVVAGETSRIVNDIEREKQELQQKYNELMDSYYLLKEESVPLRQLVLINLRDKTVALT